MAQWKFVPPNPKEEIPALRGIPDGGIGHSLAEVGTKKGISSQLTEVFGCSKPAEGGRVL